TCELNSIFGRHLRPPAPGVGAQGSKRHVLGQYACQDESDRSLAKSRLHLRLLAHRVQTRSRSRTTSGSTCKISAASSLICRIRRASRSAELGHLPARTRSPAAPLTPTSCAIRALSA